MHSFCQKKTEPKRTDTNKEKKQYTAAESATIHYVLFHVSVHTTPNEVLGAIGKNKGVNSVNKPLKNNE